jgi:glycerate 2-kinase
MPARTLLVPAGQLCAVCEDSRMRVLVAPDCFTGTLTAPQAAAAIALGWSRSAPAADLDLVPLSDGGPGFIDVLALALGGERRRFEVDGPYANRVDAEVLLAADGTAYLEAAQCCGTAVLPDRELRPLDSTTTGLGQLLAHTVRLGPSRVVVGVGGTASTDGGAGCVLALEADTGSSWPSDVPLVVATDVDNPLLGPTGAAAVFGPQKGADASQIAELENRLAAWVARTGGDPDAPGAGAGGGLGYGLALLGARRQSGVELVLAAIGLEDRASTADLLVTGEGSFDASSLRGKVARGVAWVAQRAGKPCVVLAGRVGVGRREFAAAGVDAAYSVVETAGSVEAALAHPADRLADLAERVARTWTPRAPAVHTGTVGS